MLEVTIPVLNEEKSLEQNVLQAAAFIRNEITPNFSIVIADNGSTDRTEEIGRRLSTDHNEIKYVKVPKKGVGLALRTSWMQSSANIVGYMDLDLATDLTHLKEAYDLLQNDHCDIVNGSRLMNGSMVKNRSFLRGLTTRGFNMLVRSLIGVSLSDGMCGFKFFKREVATRLINTDIQTDGWFFSTEILVKGLWLGMNLKEIPVQYIHDASSKVNVLRLSSEYMKDILRLRKEKAQFILSNFKRTT